MITIRQMEIFAEVVRYGSLRRTAEVLGISQVAVSEHVRALEKALDTALFTRRAGAAVMLTDAGEEANRRIAGILAGVWSLADGLTGRQSMKIAVPPFVLFRLEKRLEAFQAAHPEVEVVMDTADRTLDEVRDAVDAGDLDVGYAFCASGVTGAVGERVGREPLAIVVGPTHPLAGRSRVTVPELRRFPAIHLTRGRSLRTLVDWALASVGLGDTDVEIESDEFGLLLSTVHRGRGFLCMFAPQQDVSGTEGVRHPADPMTYGLVRLALDVPVPSLDVRRLYAPAGRRHTALRGLLDALDAPDLPGAAGCPAVSA
ncbi:LysR family transcriptional regulator [Streptomyces phaeochromogenes]|uniref:LysR family transcriptional regulator n=1 Tax=Streptomyces phaeochromogenes TaxID=1923 RepID=A0ABZ1HR24_STRPH|nr:LysR family transcriptional regulator [Streptomyces phaeochromogenes]WSD19688.1 LysR family transcriptional regulator [Streptomyces phaeochromogenes]